MKKILLTGALLFCIIINAQINNLSDLIDISKIDNSNFFRHMLVYWEVELNRNTIT